MKKITAQNKYLLILLWLTLICSSAVWNIYQTEQSRHNVYLETARSYFQLILTMREWVSNMGGVYVPVTAAVVPNPYLEVPDRDILLPNGTTLTKINPAYMTRLVAELAAQKNNVKFHITSLNPIRPENSAGPWEKIALSDFETQTRQEYVFFDEQTEEFYYMAPLFTQQSCLACHEKQGYQVGDIRGGISITIKTQAPVTWPLLSSHILIGLFGAVLIFIFSTRLGNAINQLEKQSHRDGLTQIFNRSYFDSYFQREYLRSRRQKTPLSVLLIDVDLFKSFNDVYGHPAGDIALKKIAHSLAEMLKRPGDLAARYGGEEFAIVLPDTQLQGARVIAEMLRAGVEQLGITHQENKVSALVTISIGCSTYTGEDIRLEEVLERADKALYLAKHSGRNMVCVFEG